jgi:hypothetical protein
MRKSISRAATAAVCVAGLLVLAGAAAAELKPYAGKSFELRDVHGVVYYTPKGDSLEVVATLDAEGHPFRVVSSLKDGQSTVLSVPGAPGEEAASFEIRRAGDAIFVIDHTSQHRAEVTLPNGRRAN